MVRFHLLCGHCALLCCAADHAVPCYQSEKLGEFTISVDCVDVFRVAAMVDLWCAHRRRIRSGKLITQIL